MGWENEELEDVVVSNKMARKDGSLQVGNVWHGLTQDDAELA